MYGCKPNYKNLRAFGCLCYVSTPNKHRTKIEARASSCVFLGYAPTQKGYKLYDLTTKKVFVSREVKFFENFFSFQVNSNPSAYMNKFFLPLSSNAQTTSITDIPSDFAPITTSKLRTQNHNKAHVSTTPLETRNKSYRKMNKPTYLQDYVNNHAYKEHLCNLIKYHALSTNYHQIAEVYEAHSKPKTYFEASQNPNWIETMDKEIQALEANKT